MKKTLSAFVALMVFAVLFIGARTVIMQVEMKDGTVRYVDTEALSEFNFIKLDEIPATQDTKYITETCLEEGLCYHSGYFTGRSHNVEIDVTYVPNDPKDYTFTIKNWADGCKPLKLVEKDDIISFPCQSTGFIDPEYGEIWVADREQYSKEVLGRDYTGFDYVTYEQKEFLEIQTMNLKVVYYAPNYGDGKTFAKEAEETILSREAPRFSLDVNDYRETADSQPYMEFRVENTSGFPTKVGINYYYVEVEENEMDSVFTYGTAIREKLEEENEAAWLRTKNHEYNFVADFSDGDTVTFRVPYSGRAYVNAYYTTFDIGGEPEITLENIGYIYGRFVYPGSNVKAPETKYGTYYYKVFFSGEDYLPLTRLTPSDSTKDVKYNLSGIGDTGKAFSITVPDMDARTDEGYIPLTVDSTYVYYHSTYGRVMAADLYWYYSKYLPSTGYTPTEEQLASITPSVMDPETESLRLNMIYFVPEYGEGRSRFGYDFEYFVLDNTYSSWGTGFNAQFSEDLEKPNRGTISISKTKMGGDIAVYKVVTVTENASETATDIKANPTKYASYRATGDETIVPIDFEYDTEYYAIIEAYTIDGKYRGEQIINYHISKPLSLDNYEYIGKGAISDGWVLPGFTINGNPIDPTEYMWEVDMYRSKEDSCEYLLAHPWVDCPIAEVNEYSSEAKRTNIKIRIEGANVAIEPQSSGFGTSNWGGPLIIGNFEGMIMSVNPGATMTDAVTHMKKIGLEQEISVFDGECIVIPKPLWGCPNIGDGSFGYYWSNLQPTYIVFPEKSAPASAPKRAPKAVPAGVTVSTEAVRAIEPQTKLNALDSGLKFVPFEKISLKK